VLGVFQSLVADTDEFNQLAICFARAGTEDSSLLEKDIQQLTCTPEGVFLGGAGFCKSIAKFWRKHKKEILIGAAILVVVVGVTAAIVCTAGVAGAAVGAAGGSAIKGLSDNLADKKENEPKQKEVTQDLPVAQLPQYTNLVADCAITSPPTLSLGDFLSSMPKEPIYLPGASINGTDIFAKTSLFSNKDYFQNPPIVGLTPPTQNITPPFSQGYEMPDPPEYFGFCDVIEAHDENLRIERRKEQDAEWKRSHTDNYAASVYYGRATNKIDVPPLFRELPLIGEPDQGTVHVHCGIKNTGFTTCEGSMAVYHSLNKGFAVQPHWIHSDSLVHGLSMVLLEKIKAPETDLTPLPANLAIPAIRKVLESGEMAFPRIEFTSVFPSVKVSELPGTILEMSDIQHSIDYEIATLSKIAQNIIKKGNPKLKQVHVTFSNGGYVFKEALKKLPPEYRETIIVITAGTTAIIDEHLACKAYNLIGDKDRPSQLTLGGLGAIEAAKSTADIRIIPQTETDGIIGGHYLLQPDYQDAIQHTIQEKITGTYEVY